MVGREPGRHVFFRAGASGVLLVFDPATTAHRGGAFPPHGATGPGHFALGVRPETLADRRRPLTASGVEIETLLAIAPGCGVTILLPGH